MRHVVFLIDVLRHSKTWKKAKDDISLGGVAGGANEIVLPFVRIAFVACDVSTFFIY